MHHPEEVLRENQELDPHLWMDVALWSQIIDPIVSALSIVDPDGAKIYEKNGAMVRKEMLEADQRLYEKMQQVPQELRYLVTSHDAFNYFTRAYLSTKEERKIGGWRKRFDAPEGLSPEGQLSTADIQEVVDHLFTYRISIVFPEANVSRDSLRKIVHACEKKGLLVRISSDVLYGDSMGQKGGEGDTYLKMIEHNAEVMIKGWNSD